MDERTRRIGLNEAVFREVNERLERLAKGFGLSDEMLDVICECGRPDCTERIELRMADYEWLRSDPRRFAVVPGHEGPDVEHVLEHRQGYDVIEKDEGEPADLARDTSRRG